VRQIELAPYAHCVLYTRSFTYTSCLLAPGAMALCTFYFILQLLIRIVINYRIDHVTSLSRYLLKKTIQMYKTMCTDSFSGTEVLRVFGYWCWMKDKYTIVFYRMQLLCIHSIARCFDVTGHYNVYKVCFVPLRCTRRFLLRGPNGPMDCMDPSDRVFILHNPSTKNRHKNLICKRMNHIIK